MKNITIGADPELFIVNSKTNDVVSSIGIIPGIKNDPYIPVGFEKGYGIETDNILAEFNIPPATTKEEFTESINLMKNYIRNYVKKVNPDYDIQCIASRLVPHSQLRSKEAKLFGCDPDYNAWTEEQNPKPEGAATNLRSAGFHIHIGYDNHNVNTSLQIVKHLDMFLGIPSVLIDPDVERRKLYGKAGAFRLQPWGVEYRVLSSYMMSSTDKIDYVFWIAKQAVEIVLTGECYLPRPQEFDIQRIINESDTAKAKEMCDKYRLPLLTK